MDVPFFTSSINDTVTKLFTTNLHEQFLISTDGKNQELVQL